jgi:GntR family transcriptional regulator
VKTSKRFFHPYPKYLQISDLLRRRILTQLKAGDRFPSEIELSGEFGVSRETIRQALGPLETEGLISRTRGRGSFVTERKLGRAPQKLTGMPEDFITPEVNTHWKLLQRQVLNADTELAGYLNLELGSPVVRIDRMMFLDREPLAYHLAFLALDIGTRVMEQKAYYKSITSVLGKKLKLALEEDQQMVEAETADVTLSEHLRVQIGSPVLLVRRLYITEGEKPLAYFKAYYRPDRYIYTVKIRQPNGPPSRRRTKR